MLSRKNVFTTFIRPLHEKKTCVLTLSSTTHRYSQLFPVPGPAYERPLMFVVIIISHINQTSLMHSSTQSYQKAKAKASPMTNTRKGPSVTA